MHKLTQCLWYLDPHHSKLASRGITLPTNFMAFQGYNDFRRKKQKEPQLSTEELTHHIDELSGVLMQPWFAAKQFVAVRADIEQLVHAMHKYQSFLSSQKEKVQARQQAIKEVHPEDSATLVTLPGNSSATGAEYSELEQSMLTLSLYQPLCVNDFAPAERYQRRQWLAKLQLPFLVMLYQYAYGNHLGTVTYAWRIPDHNPVDQTAVSRVFFEVD